MISSIIEILTDDTKSLTTALLKTQVLASRLDNNELKNWAANELKGYRNTVLLPEYRNAKANPKCTISDGFNYQENQPIPVAIFEKKIFDFLVRLPLDQGVKSLEKTASGEYGDYIVKEFGDDFGAWLSREAQKNGQKIRFTQIRILVHIGEVNQALGEIRTRLLELMLELEKQYPNLELELKNHSIDKEKVNEKIIHIMSQVNITTTGDGNLINTGSHNTFNVNTKISKGDNESLIKTLKELNISKDDIAEISQIVEDDNPDYDTKTLGDKTRGWISKMLNKTLDGTWEVATGAAGGLLSELFKNYFGF